MHRLRKLKYFGDIIIRGYQHSKTLFILNAFEFDKYHDFLRKHFVYQSCYDGQTRSFQNRSIEDQ